MRNVASLLALTTLGIGLDSTAFATAAVSPVTAAEPKPELSSDRAILSPRDEYSSGGNAKADRGTVGHILHFSDVHLNISTSRNDSESAAIPTVYGKDAPITLLVSALAYAKKVLPKPDMFLFTGDSVVRGNMTEEYLAEVVEKNVKTMAEYYATSDSNKMKDVTTVVGNADTNPGYRMNLTDPTTEENPQIALIAGTWQDSLSKADLDLFKRRGYLAYALDDTLTVLTLNTLPYSPSHEPNTSDVLDPFGQFAWLNASLAALQSAGQSCFIVGHIPPVISSFGGSPMWNETYIRTYKKIVGQYSGIIKAQLFGHVHSIEFRLPLSCSLGAQFQRAGVLGDDAIEDKADLVPLFMTGAISPIFSSNPAFMVWDYDVTTHDLLDFTVHGGNISSTSGTVDWQPLFKASQEYGVSTLKASEIVNFVKRAETDAKLLEEYYFNSKAQSRLQSDCQDATCQAEWLCSLYWFSTVRDYDACVAFTTASKSNTTTSTTSTIQ